MRKNGEILKKVSAIVLFAGVFLTGITAIHTQENVPSNNMDVKVERPNPDQIKIEDYLKKCWKEKREEIDLTPYNITENDLNKIMFGIHYEEPEYYWIIRYPEYYIDPTTQKITTYYPNYTDETGTPYNRSEELEREWEIVKMLTANCTTDVEKALVVHDHLVRTIKYSKQGGTFVPHDIEGGILEKKSVCEGYALSYKYYMNRLGVPCKIVSGVAGGISHAWNQIKIDGKWYLVDATWDDVNDVYNTVKHQYFLKSEKAFTRHSWKRENYELCEDTTYDNASWATMSKKWLDIKVL